MLGTEKWGIDHQREALPGGSGELVDWKRCGSAERERVRRRSGAAAVHRRHTPPAAGDDSRSPVRLSPALPSPHRRPGPCDGSK